MGLGSMACVSSKPGPDASLLMAIFKCAGCGFNLIEPAETCLNCNLVNPRDPMRPEKRASKILTICLLVMVPSILVAIFVVNALISEEAGTFAGILGSFLILIAFIIYSHRLSEIRKEKRQVAVQKGFHERSNLIVKRCRELHQRLERIDGVMNRIGESPNDSFVSLREKLKVGKDATSRQLARYVAIGAEFEITRLQHRLLPLVYGFGELSYGQIEQGIIDVDQTMESLAYIKGQLMDEFRPNNDALGRSEVVQRTEDTSLACQKLRASLIERQAFRALERVSPTAPEPKLQEMLSQQELIDTFNIQVDITDFRSTVDDLELEYQRLIAEDNLDRQMLE